MSNSSVILLALEEARCCTELQCYIIAQHLVFNWLALAGGEMMPETAQDTCEKVIICA